MSAWHLHNSINDKTVQNKVPCTIEGKKNRDNLAERTPHKPPSHGNGSLFFLLICSSRERENVNEINTGMEDECEKCAHFRCIELSDVSLKSPHHNAKYSRMLYVNNMLK